MISTISGNKSFDKWHFLDLENISFTKKNNVRRIRYLDFFGNLEKYNQSLAKNLAINKV